MNKILAVSPISLDPRHGRPQKKMQGGQKHSRDGHVSESYSQVSVSDRVTN